MTKEIVTEQLLTASKALFTILAANTAGPASETVKKDLGNRSGVVVCVQLRDRFSKSTSAWCFSSSGAPSNRSNTSGGSDCKLSTECPRTRLTALYWNICISQHHLRLISEQDGDVVVGSVVSFLKTVRSLEDTVVSLVQRDTEAKRVADGESGHGRSTRRVANFESRACAKTERFAAVCKAGAHQCNMCTRVTESSEQVMQGVVCVLLEPNSKKSRIQVSTQDDVHVEDVGIYTVRAASGSAESQVEISEACAFASTMECRDGQPVG